MWKYPVITSSKPPLTTPVVTAKSSYTYLQELTHITTPSLQHLPNHVVEADNIDTLKSLCTDTVVYLLPNHVHFTQFEVCKLCNNNNDSFKRVIFRGA